MQPRIEDVLIKGTGLRTKLDVRRVWKCAECDRVVKLRGQETSKTCTCRGETRFMELQEEQRWTRPHQSIKSVPEVRPDPDEFPDPPKQELPAEPETPQTAAETTESPATDAESANAGFGEGIETTAAEPLVRSTLRSLTEMLNDEDDDDEEELSSETSTESPASESDDKPRTGRKRRRRRRRRKGGSGGDPPSGQSEPAGEQTGSENIASETASVAAESGSGEPTADGAPKKKRRRRRRRRKKPEGGSSE